MIRYFLLFFVLILSVNATSYINEISFNDDEYVEVYSSNFLNLSNALFYDDFGPNKSHNLVKIQEKNSSFYLIVGENFLQNNDFSNLNCSIYSSQKSGLGYYGLKDRGEDFHLFFNYTFNLSWQKNLDLNLNLSESLSYILSSNSYINSLKTPCENNFLDESNGTSLINLSLKNDTFSCNFYFNISVNQDIFEDKIEFKFQTNLSNYTIEYWIENFQNRTIKAKINTTNINKKQYTPLKKTDLFFIKSKIYSNNCVKNSSKLVIFYSKISPQTNDVGLSCESKPEQKKEEFDSNSYIKILNLNDIKSQESNYLKYEIYKGNSRKRTVYFYINNYKESSFELEKYTKLKGTFRIYDYSKIKNISILGLDLKQEVIFNGSNLTKIDTLIRPKSQKKSFKIENFTLNDSRISFNISTNLLNYSSQCYISYLKTRVSNILVFLINKSNYNFSLNINNSILENKNTRNYYDLKLICKYKKINKKYFEYSSLEFKYDSLVSTSQTLFKNYNQNFNSILNNSKKKNLSSLSNEVKISGNVIKDNNIKNNSLYLILVGLVILVIVFLLNW